MSPSGVAANLSAVGWFHTRLDPPRLEVTASARAVLRTWSVVALRLGCRRRRCRRWGRWPRWWRCRPARSNGPSHAPRTTNGHGETVGAARNPNPLLCPATALDTWRATLTGLLGHQPGTAEPVFVRLDRNLDLLEAITRDSASQIVKRAARVAGLVGDYASHSLQAGFVSDALDAGATREQVQRHGRWNNITSIDPYYRKTLVWGRTNPSQHLASGSET